MIHHDAAAIIDRAFAKERKAVDALDHTVQVLLEAWDDPVSDETSGPEFADVRRALAKLREARDS